MSVVPATGDEHANLVELMVGAAEAGNIGRVTELIDSGVLVDAQDNDHRTALDKAIWRIESRQ